MINVGRRPRIHYPGAIYHAMARGVDGRDIYEDNIDRKIFLRSLMRITSETGASIRAYCLMGNHFHLAIQVAQVPLFAIMQRILTSYSLTFNHRHDRTGHLFQARYKSIICLNDAYLNCLIRYIHQNPVRAGLVLRSEDWGWSSRLSGGDIGNDQNAKQVDLPDFDPWMISSEKVQPTIQSRLAEEKPDLQCFAEKIILGTDISIEEFRSGSRRREIVALRKQFVHEAIGVGHRMIAIAQWLSLSSNAISRYIHPNTARKCKPDTHLRAEQVRPGLTEGAAG